MYIYCTEHWSYGKKSKVALHICNVNISLKPSEIPGLDERLLSLLVWSQEKFAYAWQAGRLYCYMQWLLGSKLYVHRTGCHRCDWTPQRLWSFSFLLVRRECGLVLSATGEMYWGTGDVVTHLWMFIFSETDETNDHVYETLDTVCL